MYVSPCPFFYVKLPLTICLQYPLFYFSVCVYSFALNFTFMQGYASWYGSCLVLKVLAPHSSKDARGLLKASTRLPDPVVFLENELL